jgi:hypothetical protein
MMQTTRDTVVDYALPGGRSSHRGITLSLSAAYPRLYSTGRVVVMGVAQTVCYTVGAYAGLGALGLLLSQLSGALTLSSVLSLAYGSLAVAALFRLGQSIYRGEPRQQQLPRRAPQPIEHEFSVTATRIDLAPAGAGVRAAAWTAKKQ